jgi:hypothetical protein
MQHPLEMSTVGIDRDSDENDSKNQHMADT